jgi:hypothetical protein
MLKNLLEFLITLSFKNKFFQAIKLMKVLDIKTAIRATMSFFYYKILINSLIDKFRNGRC